MTGHVQKMPQMHDNQNIMSMFSQLKDSGGRQSIWIRNNIDTGIFLELITSRTAEKVLSCTGNNDRLNILLAILKKTMSVAEIVYECKLNSSGQAYHHMKPLLAADIIKEEDLNFSKGTYIVRPHKVQEIYYASCRNI